MEEEELNATIQNMIDAGESEENIASVIKAYSVPVKKKDKSTFTSSKPKLVSETNIGSSDIQKPKIKTFEGFSKEDLNTMKSPKVEMPKINKNIQNKIKETSLGEELANTKVTQENQDLVNEKTNQLSELQKQNKKADLAYVPKKQNDKIASLANHFATGVADVGVKITSLPEYAYDFFSLPQNFISDIYKIPELHTNSEEFKKSLGINNSAKEYYKNEVKSLREKSLEIDNKYKDGIYESFKNGDILGGFDQLTNSFAESLPMTSSIMVGGAYMKAPQLIASSSMLFASGKNEQLKDENPNMNANARTANALVTGLIQGATESLGTGSIGAAARGLVEREGAKKAVTILKDGLVDFYKEALKKNPLLASMTGEGLQEAFQGVSENAVDVATGAKPQDYNIYGTMADDFIGGAFGGAIFGAGLKGIEYTVNTNDKKSIKANTKAVFKLQNELQNPNISEEVKTELTKNIDNLVKTNKELIGKNVTHLENLSPLKKEALTKSIESTNVINEKVKQIKLDDNITDETKQILLDNLKKDFQKDNELKNNILDGNITEVDILPLKEQDKIKRQALKELTAEQNPDGTKNIEIDNAQIVERANKIYKANEELKNPTPEAQPQAEVQKPSEAEKVEVSPIEDVVATSVELIKGSDAEIEKRMAEIEDKHKGIPSQFKNEADAKEYNALEKEMEKRERSSVLNIPLENVNDAIDTLLKKEKEMPKGFGAFIEKRDARETKEVADKYQGEVNKNEAKKDFKDAFFGNPDTWYADGLKLRESVRVFMEKGGTFKQLLQGIQKEFEQDGFSEQDAAGVIKNKLDKISKANENLRVAKDALDRKAKFLDKELVKDNENIFGERKNQNKNKLFDERVEITSTKEITFDKIDEIANFLKKSLPKANINPNDYNTQGLSQDQLIDLVAKAVKSLVSSGIDINDAITQVVTSIKEKFGDIDIDIEQVKSKLTPKKIDITSKEYQTFRDYWNVDISSGEFDTYKSGETIEREHSKARNNQEYEIEKDLGRVEVGLKALEQAKNIFGKEYVEKTLEFLPSSNLDVEKTMVAYIVLENEMDARVKAKPNDISEQKLQDLVRKKSQEYSNKVGKALRAGRFRVERYRELAKSGLPFDKIVNSMFSTEEISIKEEAKEISNVTPNDVNLEDDFQQEEFNIDAKIQKAIDEGVKKEIDSYYKSLSDNRRVKADKALNALSKIKSRLRENTYDASLGIPVSIIDKGITTIEEAIKVGLTVADAVEMGIRKIKELYGKDWDNENKFRKDFLKEFNDEGISTIKKDINDEQKAKQLIKQSLIDAGFSREVNYKGEKVKRLDWTKLAGEAGTIQNIKKNVEEALSKNLSKKEIADIQKSLEKEYVSLSENIIEKGLRELQKRNTPRKPVDIKTIAKKMVELYNYGLFKDNKVEYNHLLNNLLGLSPVDQKTYNELNEIALGYKRLLEANNSEASVKNAINDLSARKARLLSNLAYRQGNRRYKAATIFKEISGLSTRFKLVGLGTLGENLASGVVARVIDRVSTDVIDLAKNEKNTTKELRNQSKINAKAKLKGIVFDATAPYGDTSSLLLSHSDFEDRLNSVTNNKAYHSLLSVYMAKPFLEGADSYNKIRLTEAKMVRGAVRILQEKGMTNREAIDYVSTSLTGQSYKDAQTEAKLLIDKINTEAGKIILDNSTNSINSLASDIVKDALVRGGKMTQKEMESVYNAGYKSAGRDIGHVSNNSITTQVQKTASEIETKLEKSIKEKDWNKAAWLTIQQTMYRNFAVPFVGGGTNWLVKNFQTSANPLALISLIDDSNQRKNKTLDFTTDKGISEIEEILMRDMNFRNTASTIVMGTLTSVAIASAVIASGTDDDLEKWLKKNLWAKKYVDKLMPNSIVAILAYKNKDFGRYFQKMFNVKPDAFDDAKNIVKTATDYAKGKTEEANTKLGKLIGSKFEIPIPIRTYKDAKQIYNGIVNGKNEKPKYDAKGFWNALLMGGLFDEIGLRPEKVKKKRKSKIN